PPIMKWPLLLPKSLTSRPSRPRRGRADRTGRDPRPLRRPWRRPRPAPALRTAPGAGTARPGRAIRHLAVEGEGRGRRLGKPAVGRTQLRRFERLAPDESQPDAGG